MKLPLLVLLSLVGIAISQDKAPNSLPAAQSSGEQVYRVGRDVKPPRPISTPQPSYPKQAREGRRAGPIVVRMVVGSDGRTHDVKVQRGISPALDQAAVEAVEKWQFKPATKEGKPVAVLVDTEFDFQP